MKIIKNYSVFIIVCLFVVFQQNASACTCGGYPSVCEAYNSADAVLIGTVTKVEDIENLKTIKGTRVSDGKEITYSISGFKHYIKVEKTYKGTPQNEIILATEDSSCGGNFKIGARLLLYAYFNKEIKMWEISSCGRNTMMETANDDLLFLNGLPKTLNRTRISGDLARYEDTPESGFERTQIFSDAKLKIASKTKTFEVFTDQNGVYEIYDLPPDIYSITPDIPKGLKIRFPIYYGFGGFLDNLMNDRNSASVDLSKTKCVGVDFLFNTNNKIGGRVIDVKGKPMKDVCLDLIPLTENKSPYFRIFDCTKEDGKYVLDDMPAGKYLILANADGKVSSSEPFPKLYYPNTFDKEKATVITIGEGENLQNFDIKVPSQSETITVSGTLLHSDGKPVIDEFVEFRANNKQEGIDDSTNTKTDSQGRFTLKVLKGLKGKIFGAMFTYVGEFENCPILDGYIKNETIKFDYFNVASPKIEISAINDLKDVVLRFPFPNCKKAKID